MAGTIQINAISNANVYLDGRSLLGKAEEIKCPDVSAVMQERKALGMIGKIELPMGFDKMEGEIKWNSLYLDVAILTANPLKAYSLQCRSNIMQFNSGGLVREMPLVTYLTVRFTKNPAGTFKHQESPDLNSSFTCTYIKQVIDGQEVLEMDYMANIFRVNGRDILMDYRANIGG